MFSIGSYQNDVAFGLRYDPEAEFQHKLQDEALWDGVTQWRQLSELPTGQVDYGPSSPIMWPFFPVKSAC